MNSTPRHTAVVAVLMLACLTVGCAHRRPPAADALPSPTPMVLGTAAPTAPGASRTATGLPNVGPIVPPTPAAATYTVQPGDTLSAIAARFGVELDAMIQANQLADPNALQVGQQLNVPSTQLSVGPSTLLLPDSEFVNSPAYLGFDTLAYSARRGGYLSQYSENVGGQLLTGPEIVERIALEYSVGPRLLLAVLESKSGWVTNVRPAGLAYPLGYQRPGAEGLRRQLELAANDLNKGYYDWRGRGANPISWGDGTGTAYAPTLNAATAGVQYFYSLNATLPEWKTWIGTGPDSFKATYQALFGDPFQYEIRPLIPSDTLPPTLDLPWARGEMWYYTSGPHGAWGEGSAWAAIDAVPDEGYLGCQVARSWETAAADGVVVYSQEGMVLLDLDGDGHEQTGWVLLYLHVATDGRVPVGSRVSRGDPIGHPSCEGGFGDATHLHFARKYNGEWIAADGPLPLLLSGWQFHSSGTSYDGTATRGDQERTACECQTPEINGLVAEE